VYRQQAGRWARRLKNMDFAVSSRLRFFAFSLIAVAVCYANSVSNPFLQDDLIMVSGNEQIRHVAPGHFLTSSYSQDQRLGGLYRPLTILSLSVDYAVWGNQATGFRITNLFLHIVNGCLVFTLANMLLGSAPASWAAAAIYLVHPVHTEAVVGIVGRSELLGALCFFTAWWLFRNGYTLLSCAAFLLALLSKENAITFPAVMALDVLCLGGGLRDLLRQWRRFLVLAGTALAYLGLRLWVIGGLVIPKAIQYAHGSLSSLQRIMTTGRVFLQYFKLVLAPVNVVGVYEFYSIPTAGLRDWVAWTGLILVAAIIVSGVILARIRPTVGFAILFFFLTLLPVSNWFIPIGAIMGERFLYTPLFGAALLAGLSWNSFPTRRIQQVVAAGALFTAMCLCIAHNRIWHDDFSFYSNMVRIFPNNISGRLGYGYAMLQRGRTPEAIEQFEAAHRILPMRPEFLADVAATITRQDPLHCDQARPLLDAAFRQEPNHWQSYWMLANCAAAQHRWESADESYRLASLHSPSPNADLLFSWGLTLEALNRKKQAVEAYEQALRLKPDDMEIRRRIELLERESDAL
jgi:tetratricopeptide (TPR) repeat protein